MPATKSMLILLAALPLAAAWANDDVHYNRDVLPILSENCFKCHGFDKTARKAGLRLDQREAALAALKSGVTAIVPGDLQASELIKRITTHEADDVMPPTKTGKHLTPKQVDTLRQWIAAGAVYEKHWAFIPPSRSATPGSIDAFIGARLEAEGIRPAPEADRVTLIRRLSLDLTGLPPSLLEVDAFLHDTRSDAYQRAVERLLASEHFGEKWARWWLDLAHYADSDGYLTDQLRPWAWRYRQWVVDALNWDMPFDQFTIAQIAGDRLPEADEATKIATGFLRNTLSNREGGADLEEYRVRQVVDRTSTVGTVWLGLTLGCAECHDHKFDPVTQREFYQLYAFFNDADEVNLAAPLRGEDEPYRKAKAAHDRKRAELIAPVAGPLAELQAAWEAKLLDAEIHPGREYVWDRALEVLGLVWGGGQGEGQLEGVNIMKTPVAERTQDQKDRLLNYFLDRGSSINPDKFKELKLTELTAKLNALAKELPPVSRAPVIVQARLPRPTHLHVRGDFRQLGDAITAGIPAVLPGAARGDRLALARWIASPENPLTARVTVNRLWQELFGRGLVTTPDNFGVRGMRPSHPELLDWLALEFMSSAQPWSLKHMLRLMVNSATYRQSSAARPELQTRDSGNELFARQSRLRLSAEAVRDVSLAASGLLNRTIGGPSVRPPQPDSVAKEGFDNKWETSQGADRYRRGLYTFLQRTSPFAQSVTFDFPDSIRACTRRERSNTPLQALTLLNDPVFVEMAQALAARVQRETSAGDEQRMEHLYELCLARPPSAAERDRLLRYLNEQRTAFEHTPEAARELAHNPESAAWVAVASVVMNLDEFITRE